MSERIAKALLDIGAVELRPEDPFTWSSGMKSPIYCDNRLTMSYPAVRKEIAEGLAQLIRTHFPEAEVIAGTATAGIPHAAWVSDLLELPMVYVRSKPKNHGQGNQIEGKLIPGQKIIVIEDLISKGGSCLQAAAALKEAGADVCGVAAIFSYGLPEAEQALQGACLPYHTLTDFRALADTAEKSGKIDKNQLAGLEAWHEQFMQKS
ncbi:orotate phosphoribosyltransferase [Indiicoccus explosivorum]|uniref:orotate phosphoribosyltransferase n=1 Tax=Indiicoccus explosivorum TaxID=1917864 RepID=UPI000B4311EC|nr:orotate phosphoribosyltransferase [Indiicoccus explosivorum]